MLFSNRSLIFFRREALQRDLLQVLPIAKVTITPAYRARSIDISGTFLKPAAKLELPEETIFLDEQGRVLTPTLEPFDAGNLLRVKSITLGYRRARSVVLAPGDLQRYRTLERSLSERGKPMLWLLLGDDPDTLEFQMKDDWTLKISWEEPESIIKRLDIFFAERKKQPVKHPLEYIDLRFGDKIISKERV